MLAPIHPASLTLLIQGLPESLKTFVANFQNGIREVHVQNTTAPKQQEGWIYEAIGCSYLEWICAGISELRVLDEMGWIIIVKVPEHPTATFSVWLSEEKWFIKVEMLVRLPIQAFQDLIQFECKLGNSQMELYGGRSTWLPGIQVEKQNAK